MSTNIGHAFRLDDAALLQGGQRQPHAERPLQPRLLRSGPRLVRRREESALEQRLRVVPHPLEVLASHRRSGGRFPLQRSGFANQPSRGDELIFTFLQHQ